jgi:CheY-like chemotaxis protein
MRPVPADSGPAALAALEQAVAAGQPLPLVLLDAHMPGMDGFTLAGLIQRRPELAKATVVLLISAGRPADVACCRELEIDAYLMKPVEQSELLDAIQATLSGTLRRTSVPGPAPRPTSGQRPLHVLLAEDSPVNQKLAVCLLEKEGHTVVVAGNGREALAALERQAFDLVLMDVQMPEMDGLEATATIRRNEQGTGRHVPILALTAHAMKSDRERCLKAGMDAYLSKPIRLQELFDAVGRLVPRESRAVEGPAEEVLDRTHALAAAGGDASLLRELVQLFGTERPRWLTDIRAAVSRRDAEPLRRSIHILRGSLETFGARSASAAARRLEEMAGTGDLTGADTAYAELVEELERLQPALQALQDEGEESESARTKN